MSRPKLKIKEVLNKNNISQYELAKRLSIPPHHVTNMVKSDFNPTFKTLLKIAEAIKCKVRDLIDE